MAGFRGRNRTPPALVYEERQYSDLQILRRLVDQARPFWLHIVGVLALSLVAAPLALLAPVPLKIAVDCVVGTDPVRLPLAGRGPDDAGTAVRLESL